MRTLLNKDECRLTMSEILYDANLIDETELHNYSNLIYSLQAGKLRPPKVKRLQEMSYHGKPVYRAKINKKERLIYIYVEHAGVQTPCILAVNDHNYQRLKRQLKSTTPLQVDSIDLPEGDENLVEAKAEKTTPIKFRAAVPHKNTMIAWDEEQQQCYRHNGAAIFSGPPGAGKTLVLYNKMLHDIYAQEAILNGDELPPILFISQSQKMTDLLKEEYQKLGLRRPVKFVTWDDYIASHYPGKTQATEQYFKIWLKTMKLDDEPRALHYELSLILALGEEKYLQLGKRQCHFAEDKEKQQKLIKLLKLWQDYLKKFNLFDPMVSVVEMKENFATIYGDEAQNLPPAAFASLLSEGKPFLAGLDSEQCLLSSPYVHNCLKELLYKHYGDYTEIQLAKTWRCPPEIMAVGNHLMDRKYRIDGGNNRREYNNVESMLPKGSGLISWVDKQNLSKLKDISGTGSTVVIVNSLTDELRAEIEKTLGTTHILTPKEAIGGEFDNVILWNPLSSPECLRELSQRKQLEGSGLSIEQWNEINALRVSITRAQKRVYLYDDMAHKRLKTLPEYLLGELPKNQFNHSGPIEDSKEQWHSLATNYLAEGKIENAKAIFRFNLGYSESEITAEIKSLVPQRREPEATTTSTSTTSTTTPSTTTNTTQSAVNSIRTNSTTKTAQTKKNNQPTPTTPQQKPEEKEANLNQNSENDRKRINRILNNFNQKTLKELFNSKDGMKFLFEIPLEQDDCLFSYCVNNHQFLAIFQKFINENGNLVSKKLPLDRLILVKGKLMGFAKPSIDEKYTLIAALYQQCSRQTILHDLLQKYPLEQRIIFVVDSLFYSPCNNYLAKDKEIHRLLSYSERLVSKNLRKIVDSLLKPTKYAPELSYLHYLCNPDFTATQMIMKLLTDQTLIEFLCENLFIVPQNCFGSIFYSLSCSSTGVKILEKLIAYKPELKEQVTIDDLLAKRPEISPPFFHNLCADPSAHPLLNQLLTPELAAKVPHELPNVVNLISLSFQREGTEVILRMMDAQSDMIAKMTGKAICTRLENLPVTMLSLLTANRPSILNRLLDFHGKNLVDQLTEEAMFTPLTKATHQASYEALHQTIEGQQFLKGLASYGWKLPPSQIKRRLVKVFNDKLPFDSKIAFFSTSKEMFDLSCVLLESDVVPEDELQALLGNLGK